MIVVFVPVAYLIMIITAIRIVRESVSVMHSLMIVIFVLVVHPVMMLTVI